MNWLKPLLPLIQSGLSMYASGQMMKKTSANAKSVAIRSSIVGFGSLSFLVFFVTSVVMTFVDLGNQFETRDGVHFSGMMLSSLYLTGFGLMVFGICFGISQYLGSKERQKKELEKAEVNPYASLILFGEELLKNLINNLNQKSDETKS